MQCCKTTMEQEKVDRVLEHLPAVQQVAQQGLQKQLQEQPILNRLARDPPMWMEQIQERREWEQLGREHPTEELLLANMRETEMLQEVPVWEQAIRNPADWIAREKQAWEKQTWEKQLRKALHHPTRNPTERIIQEQEIRKQLTITKVKMARVLMKKEGLSFWMTRKLRNYCLIELKKELLLKSLQKASDGALLLPFQ
ncbi:hypothetical protein ANCDUO_13806 [Ancylostoma duodenale]|uniref:Uncharacterized protein n=1 Tax=Ancylostoma duodenale TaxID=51022 RepID=A0A0C2GFX5_9BILA|nr:hypothetical protein ANCDUO_13806 [Ancylostoma duodenale]